LPWVSDIEIVMIFTAQGRMNQEFDMDAFLHLFPDLNNTKN